MSASERVVGEDFLLPPEAFVRRCAERCGPEGAGVTEMELAELAEAVRHGRPRLEILDAMLARCDPTDPRLQRINTAALRRDFRGEVVLDVLLRYAPGDDATFVRYAFEQIVTRPPTGRELLSLDFDLRCGRTDRRAIVNRLTALARVEGVQAVVSGDALPESGPGGGAWVTGGQTIDGQGRDLIVFVRQHAGLGWVLAPGYWHQPVETTEDGWTIRPGWVLTGPKRNLARGVWRLDVDFLQGEDATMFLDVVANSGLDILAKALFEGPTHCALRFTIADWHHFVEVRLLKPEETSEKCWVKIRNLSLAPVG
jgi:hypothetical protein